MDSLFGLAHILEHTHDIVAAVGMAVVTHYVSLLVRYAGGSVDHDPAFQRAYAQFHMMSRRGLTPEFRRRYFECLEGLRGQECIDVDAIVRDLYDPATGRGCNSFQYSCVTKLAHTVNPGYPIYDALIAEVCGFRPSDSQSAEERLQSLSVFYSRLTATYDRIWASGMFMPAIRVFHERYGTDSDTVSDIKVIDFLLRAAVKRRYQPILELSSPGRPGCDDVATRSGRTLEGRRDPAP